MNYPQHYYHKIWSDLFITDLLQLCNSVGITIWY